MAKEQMEEQLLNFVVSLISKRQMHGIKKLFFVPVGLPGMGKSTLAKGIREATNQHLSGGKDTLTDVLSQSMPILGAKRPHTQAFPENEARPNIIDGKVLPDVGFFKISYDRILGDNLNAYAQDHPDTPFHEIIDIIRDKADRDYLDQVAAQAGSNDDPLPIGRSRTSTAKPNLPKTIVFLDRNNTPDVWGDIRDTIAASHEGRAKDYRTVVLLPKMEAWPKEQFRAKNPICPHLVYECCKRIFGRKEHGCLNSENKPKAVEVVLKFAKLHDGFDFDDRDQILSYFDDVLTLDFMQHGKRA